MIWGLLSVITYCSPRFRPISFFLTGNSSAFSQGLNVITDPCVKDASVPSPTASWWESTIPRGTKSVCSAPCVNSPSPTAVTSEKGNFTANTTTNSKHSFREGLFAFPPSLSHFLSLFLCVCISSHCFGDSVIFLNHFFQKWVHWMVSVDLTRRPPVRKSSPETSFSCSIKCYLNFKKKDVTVKIRRLKWTCCHRSFLRWFIFTSCKMHI